MQNGEKSVFSSRSSSSGLIRCSHVFRAMGCHGSSQSDLSNYMERRDELEEELKQEMLNAITEYENIHRAIRRMKDEEEKEILERKYLMRQTWERIAEELDCDRSTAIRKHGNALENFEIPESCDCMHR